MPKCRFRSVQSGWQYRVYLDETIIGGWAPTRKAAARRAEQVLDDG